MQTSDKNLYRSATHPLVWAALLAGLLLMAACQPIQDPGFIAAQETVEVSEAAVPAGTPGASAVGGVEAAEATIATATLRVRALPSDDAEVVASAEEGETFDVTGISSDGAWIQVAIEDGPDGFGWISAEFVTLTGDITSIAVVDVEDAEATGEADTGATEEATDEATPDATEEAAEEATEEATPEPTGEATPEVTEEADEEATPVATEEATEEPTEEATEEATPTATEEATEEATAEATPDATEEASGEATAEATEEATEEATPEPTDEASEEEAASDLGTVTIVVELPLRVRSEPTTEVDNKIGSVYNGEVYTVLEVSDDGLWLLIETPQFPEGSGWISAEFAVFNEAE